MTKKYKLLILALVLAILAGCSTPGDSPTPDEGPVQDDGPIQDEGPAQDDSPIQDYGPIQDEGGSEEGDVFCVARASITDDAVYYTTKAPVGGGRRLAYYDRASGISGYLCAQPDCDHTGVDCTAFTAGMDYGLGYYDGRIYWIDCEGIQTGPVYLFSCAPDGTDRKKICTYYEACDFGNFWAIYHRGYLYSAFTRKEVTDAVGQMVTCVFAHNLETGEAYTVLRETKAGTSGVDFWIDFNGDDMYIMSWASDLITEDIPFCYRLRVFHTDTRQMEEIGTYDTGYAHKMGYVPGKGIYVAEIDTSNPDGSYHYIIYRIDPRTGSSEAVMDIPSINDNVLITEEYLMTFPRIMEDGTVSFTAWDYDNFEKVEFPAKPRLDVESCGLPQEYFNGDRMEPAQARDGVFCGWFVDFTNYVVFALDGSFCAALTAFRE